MSHLSCKNIESAGAIAPRQVWPRLPIFLFLLLTDILDSYVYNFLQIQLRLYFSIYGDFGKSCGVEAGGSPLWVEVFFTGMINFSNFV